MGEVICLDTHPRTIWTLVNVFHLHLGVWRWLLRVRVGLWRHEARGRSWRHTCMGSMRPGMQGATGMRRVEGRHHGDLITSITRVRRKARCRSRWLRAGGRRDAHVGLELQIVVPDGIGVLYSVGVHVVHFVSSCACSHGRGQSRVIDGVVSAVGVGRVGRIFRRSAGRRVSRVGGMHWGSERRLCLCSRKSSDGWGRGVDGRRACLGKWVDADVRGHLLSLESEVGRRGESWRQRRGRKGSFKR